MGGLWLYAGLCDGSVGGYSRPSCTLLYHNLWPRGTHGYAHLALYMKAAYNDPALALNRKKRITPPPGVQIPTCQPTTSSEESAPAPQRVEDYLR